ncbi:MAG: type IV secretion protein IcmL [Alphaproteobacteria bacterium]|nr:MAG: type IV secretion protein IcmL [Alphaproteobacteria bacterium]
MATMDQEPEETPEEEAGAEVANPTPAVPESPLVGLVRALGGGKKAAAAPVAGKPGAKPAATAVAKPAIGKQAMAKQAAAQQGQLNPGKAPPISGPLLTIVTRNEFYRDGFRNLIKIAIIEGIVIVGLILTLLVYIQSSQPQDRYFATTADGRIMQMTPLDQPNMDTPALLSWVAASAADVMTFNYTDYQRRLQQSSRHFTKVGWETFAGALQRSRIIDSVTAGNQMVSAQPKTAPVLVQEGPINGKYRWVVNMPLLVNYKGTANARQDTLQLSLVIERVAALENPNGVGIAQWVAQ